MILNGVGIISLASLEISFLSSINT
jgi:hypothetical protein